MKPTLATVSVTFSLLITLVIALPTTRISRDVAAPSEESVSPTLSVTQTRGSLYSSDITTLGNCVQVKNSKVPTTLRIQSDRLSLSSSSYQLVGYSTENCGSDDDVVSPSLTVTARGANGVASLEINYRRPICSYSLGKTPFSDHSVTVRFTYSDQTTSRSDSLDNVTTCPNLCGEGSPWEAKYPEIVELQQNDGSVANNFVKIFSGSGCEDGSEILNSKGGNRIYNGVELQTLTRNSRAIKSFKIIGQ